MDERVDNEMAKVRSQTCEAMGTMAKEVQGHLRRSHKQMAPPPCPGCRQAHTERAWLHVVASGLTAVANHAEASKKQEELVAQVKQLTTVIERLMSSGLASSGVPMETDGSSPEAVPRDIAASKVDASDGADPKILWANTHVEVGRAQVHECTTEHLAQHTTVPSSAVKVAGPEAAKGCGPGSGTAELRVRNIHKFGSQAERMQQVEDLWTADVAWEEAVPLTCMLLVMGDFNVQAEGPQVSYGMP